jgi:hypothetical protein
MPAGLYLATASSGDTLAALTSITVAEDGGFSAAAGTGLSTGVAVTVDGYLSLGGGTVKFATSSVGEKGTLSATGTVTVVAATDKVSVVGGSTVNGVRFPNETDITAIAANALTIKDLTVGTGKTFKVPANTALTIAAGGTLTATGNVEVEATGSLVLTGAADTGGAKITGAGNVVVGNVSITGGANSGAWQAVSAATTSIAFGSTTAAAVSITGTGTSPKLVGLTHDGAAITLAKGHATADGAALTVDNVTLDLATKGSIVFPYVGTTAATLVLKGGGAAAGALKLGAGTADTTNAKLGSNELAISGTAPVIKGNSDTPPVAGLISGGTTATTNDATITGKVATTDVTVKAGDTLKA